MASLDQYIKKGSSSAVSTGISLLENIKGQSKKFQRRSRKAAALLFGYDAFQNFLNRNSINKLKSFEDSFAGPLEEMTTRWNKKQTYLDDITKRGGSYTYDGDKIKIDNLDQIKQSFIDDEITKAMGTENLITRGKTTGLSEEYRKHLINSGTAKAEAFLENQGRYDWSLRTLADQKKYVKDQMRLATKEVTSPSSLNPIRFAFDKVAGMFGEREDIDYVQNTLDYVNTLRDNDKQLGGVVDRREFIEVTEGEKTVRKENPNYNKPLPEFTGTKYKPRSLNSQQLNMLINGFNDGTFKLEEGEETPTAITRVSSAYTTLSQAQGPAADPNAIFAQTIGSLIASPSEKQETQIQNKIDASMTRWRNGNEVKGIIPTDAQETAFKLRATSQATGIPLTAAEQASLLIDDYNIAYSNLQTEFEKLQSLPKASEQRRIAEETYQQNLSLLKTTYKPLFANDPSKLYIQQVLNEKEKLMGPDVTAELRASRLSNYIELLNAAIQPANPEFDASTLSADQISSIVALQKISPFMKGSNTTFASLIGFGITPEDVQAAQNLTNINLPSN
jgi:hypothetical protein